MLGGASERPKGAPRSETGVALPTPNMVMNHCVWLPESVTLYNNGSVAISGKINLPDFALIALC